MHGELLFLDELSLLKFLIRLTEKFENNPHSASLVQKMDEQYVKEMMKAIVAFEIKVSNIEHVFKLSQNKEPQTRDRIISHLEKEGNPLSKTMQQHFNKH